MQAVPTSPSKKWQLLAATFMLLFTILASGCSTNLPALFSTTADVASTAQTIHIYLPEEVDSLTEIADAFEEQTKDTLNIQLEFHTVSEAEYYKEIDLLLSLGEDIDLIYTSPSLNLSSLISNNQLLSLDDYFNNPDYPGLYATFSETDIEANLYDDVLYGLPLSNGYTEICGVIYRQDLLEAANLGFTQITNAEELLAYSDYIYQSNLGISALGLTSDGFCYTFEQTIDALEANIYTVPGYSTQSVPMTVVLSEDQRTVEAVLFLGDDLSLYESLSGNVQYDFMAAHYFENVTLNQYVQPNSILTASSVELLMAGSVAAIQSTLDHGTISLQNTLQQTVPGATLSFYPYDTALLSEDIADGSLLSSMRAESYLCIPASSENVDATIAFLDWLYTSQENSDLFSYGVEGLDWQADSEGNVLLLENESYTYYPCYLLTLSDTYNRTLSGVSEWELQFIEIQHDETLYSKSPLSDFLLDTTYISSEMVQLQNLYSEYALQLNAGSYGEETAEIIAEIGERAATSGIEAVRSEIKKQVQLFLNAQN